MSGNPKKTKNFKRTMGQLMLYMKPYRGSIILVAVFAVLGTLFGILGPKMLGMATTTVFEGTMDKLYGSGVGIDFVYIGKIILILIGLYILSAVFSFAQGYIMSGVAMKVTYNLRKDISEKINRMPLGYFDTHSNGEVLSRITNDVDTVSSTLNQSLTQMITAVVTVVGIIVMMFTISWIMTLVALIVLPISLVGVSIIAKKSQRYFKQQQDLLGNVNGYVEETFGGQVVVRSFSAEERSIREFKEQNEKLYGSAWKSQFLSGLMMPVMMFIGNIGYVGVSILGGVLAVQGSISVGDIQSFIQYMKQFTQPITQTANIANVLQSTAAAAERVFEFLAEENEIPDTSPAKHIESPKGKVDFNDVSFGYLPNKTIINNFSSSIKPGQKVAIVGPTGAGKTTLIKLLMRFYDVNSGSISVDGIDIKDLMRSELRSHFGMVLQETWQFNGSIMENLRYGRLSATDEEVIEAAKLAHVDEFVKVMPGGYDMILSEDASNISQGQKQLLTIARAILADPVILILDEATSSVDTRTEVLIQKAMEKLMQGRTSFIIAHRLSTIKDADLILVMKDGDIIEQGSHDDLMAQKGFYSALYMSQFEKTA